MERIFYVFILLFVMVSSAYGTGGGIRGQLQGQLQGQKQGQFQGQGQHQKAKSNSTAVSGAIAGSKSGAYSGSNSYSGSDVGVGVGLSSDVELNSIDAMKSKNANDVSISNYSSYKEAASSAVSGPLVTSNNTCMGSVSAGGQGMAFGFSVGSTWVDEDCVRRLDAAFLAKMGDVVTAKELMCQKESVRTAYAAAGNPCAPQPVIKANLKSLPKVGLDSALYNY